MKNFYKLSIFFAVFLITAAIGCKDFLAEDNPSNITSEKHYKTKDGFESIIVSSYPLLRNITEARKLVLGGTDIFSTTANYDGGGAGPGVDTYDVTFNSESSAVKNLWDMLYVEISRCNTAIAKADLVVDKDPNVSMRVGEVKFLRAYSYFIAVQQWGYIPMPLTPATSASRAVKQVPASKVYDQILKDLNDAVNVLPDEEASDDGRVTKGAAQFLLARVYLTLGWNFTDENGKSIGGAATDFDKALQYADKLIEEYPLADNYSDIFPNQYPNQNPYPLDQTISEASLNNPEIIFSVQYGDDPIFSANDPAIGQTYSSHQDAPGNNAHSIFGGVAENIPGSLGETSDYNRYLNRFVATPALYRLFDTNIDRRYKFNFVQALYALKNVPNFNPDPGNSSVTINIPAGDTVVYYRSWNQPANKSEKGLNVGGTKRYAVYNVSEYDLYNVQFAPYISKKNGNHPLMWKFFQPGIEYGDDHGTLSQPLFRVSEAYLIAAEAIVKGATGGKLGGASNYYNKVVDRALGNDVGGIPYRSKYPGKVSSYPNVTSTSIDSVSYRAGSGDVTIDMILDERARELMGENVRWYDLKRTQTLISRAKVMNPWTKLAGKIDKHDYLRPIPQREIDLSSTPVKQNPGY